MLILGVGSELRSDDSAGLHVAKAVSAAGLPGVHVINAGPAPENCTAEIRALKPSTVVIVDCAQMGDAPGSLRVIEPSAIGGASFGTHGLALSVLADYLRREIGCAVVILGIQPARLEFGEVLSAPVRAGVDEAASVLIKFFS